MEESNKKILNAIAAQPPPISFEESSAQLRVRMNAPRHKRMVRARPMPVIVRPLNIAAGFGVAIVLIVAVIVGVRQLGTKQGESDNNRLAASRATNSGAPSATHSENVDSPQIAETKRTRKSPHPYAAPRRIHDGRIQHVASVWSNMNGDEADLGSAASSPLFPKEDVDPSRSGDASTDTFSEVR